MDESQQEKQLSRLFRGYLQRELSRPEVEQAKNRLVLKFSAPEFSPSPMQFIPMLGLVALTAFLFSLQVPLMNRKFSAPVPQVSIESKNAAARPVHKDFIHKLFHKTKRSEAVLSPLPPAPDLSSKNKPMERSEVEVKKLTSQTSAVMVYQKVHQNTPFTIIWVLSGGP